MKYLKRQMKKAQNLANSAKNNAGKVVASATVLGASAANAAASVTVPTPDYTTFYGVVTVGLAVTLIVGLARKSKGFLK